MKVTIYPSFRRPQDSVRVFRGITFISRDGDRVCIGGAKRENFLICCGGRVEVEAE